MCTACNIAQYRKHIVSGSGNLKSKIMFIGEAPGHKENIEGIPFVGDAGQILNNALHLIGFNREDVYITNIIKCRPPNNRIPSVVEVENCVDYLITEINTIRPKIIVTLGKTALNTITGKNYRMNEAHGKIIELRDGLYLMPMYHPAYVNYNRDNLFIVKQYIVDFMFVARVYKRFVDGLHITNIKVD